MQQIKRLNMDVGTELKILPLKEKHQSPELLFSWRVEAEEFDQPDM